MGLKSYFNIFFAAEGDIFNSYTLEWAPMRKLIIEGLFTSLRKMETNSMLNVPSKVISDLANTIDAGEKIRVRVDWNDRAIGDGVSKQEHNVVVRESQIIRDP